MRSADIASSIIYSRFELGAFEDGGFSGNFTIFSSEYKP